jgi:hypothetical protein
MPLAIQNLVERSARQAYSNISDVERKSEKLYKVSSRDAQGHAVELYLDARSADMLSMEDSES